MTTTTTGPPDRGDNARRPPHPPARNRLTRLMTTASTRPWAVLWVPVPVAWQRAAQSAVVNRLEEGLALVLTLPYLAGLACVAAWV